MIVIGVTGGMASGKTTVASHIEQAYGLIHLNADAMVHDLMNSDPEVIAEIARAFPEALADGAISRAALSVLIANNASVVPHLEAILHPRVRAAEERAIEEARATNHPGVVLDIPLLFEGDAHTLCDKVIAVRAGEKLRRERAFARPGMSEEKWNRLAGRQLSEEEKCRRADAVVDNRGSEEDMREQVAKIMRDWGVA